jgi:hypothetical protein
MSEPVHAARLVAPAPGTIRGGCLATAAAPAIRGEFAAAVSRTLDSGPPRDRIHPYGGQVNAAT